MAQPQTVPMNKTFGSSDSEGDRKHVAINMGKLANVDSYEIDLLNRTVKDAAEWAYGIVAVDVWAFREEDGILFRPEGARHVDIAWQTGVHDMDVHEKDYANCSLCRLLDPTHPQYLGKNREASPGVELPGMIWSELSRPVRARRASVIAEDHQETASQNTIRWRSISSIADDPDQPYSEGIQLLNKLGIGWVAGVPFNVNGTRGLVLYYSRSSVDLRRLQSSHNEDYLMAASDFIGSAWALRFPRLRAVNERRERLEKTLRRVRVKLLALLAFGLTLKEIRDRKASIPVDVPESNQLSDLLPQTLQDAGKLIVDGGMKAAQMTRREVTKDYKWSEKKLRQLWRKSKGSRVRGPPAFTWEQTLVTGFGVLCTIAVILNLNEHIVDWYGADYGMSLGPLASFTASLYMLTAAPATQPRNNLVAQTCSMVVGLCIAYATPIQVWVREMIAVTVCIMLQVKFGFIHAPAAGLALSFAGGAQKWTQVPTMICANIIAIVVATIINNLNDKRQYPTAWGFQPLFRYIDDRRFEAEKKRSHGRD